MSDLVFVTLTIVFFAVALGYTALCDRGDEVTPDQLALLVVTVLLLGYLVYALVRPEAF